MDRPTMFESQLVASDTHCLPSYLPIAGFGLLAVNAFVIQASQPVLVDTGLSALREDFMRSLRGVIDPEAIRWIWLTHTDPDHIGNLAAILAEAPRARVITTFLGMGKMGLLGLPLERTYLLNPGQSLDIGDRQLRALQPPVFDAPETTGFVDTRTRALFSADCFGALLTVPVEAAGGIAPKELRDGLVTWATVDSPWLHMVNEGYFRSALESISEIKPSVVLSSHLPFAAGMTEILLANLSAARNAPRFVGPDQKAAEKGAMTRPTALD